MTKTAPSRMDILKNQEASLSSEVIKLETEHKDLASKHREYLKKARDIEIKVDELNAKIDEYTAKFEEIIEANNELVRKMNSVSMDRAEKLASLDAVRTEIESLTVISIGVLKNCEFEVIEGNFQIDLSRKEEEINVLTHKLMDQEICEDLTARQIRTLSRVIILKNSSSRKLEFVFDSSELESTYTYLASNQPLSF